MSRTALLTLATLGLFACQNSSDPLAPGSAAQPDGIAPLAVARHDGIPGQYIVVFKQSVGDAPGRSRQLVSAHGGKLLAIYRSALKGFAARLPEAGVQSLRAAPDVAYIEQDQVMQAITIVQLNATWGLDRLDQRDLPLSRSYSYDADGSGVKVYIIDTGIRLDHTEFGGRASAGFDAVTPGGTAADCNGHGTHVAGTVGGSTYGVAKAVSLVAVRVLDCGGSGTTSGVIQGIDWVTTDHVSGPAAANMSLGGGASQALDDAVTRSITDGVTYGVAAGNSNADACAYSPARTPSALTVGATTDTDARSSFSNFGSCVDLFAPGSSITSAWYTSTTATNTISGTSMATPHVVGAAALYLQTSPGATPAAVEAALEGFATPNKVTGAGTGSPNLLLYTAGIVAGPPPPAPAGPTGLSATALDHQRIALDWTDNATNETSYEVQRASGSTFAAIATLPADAKSYTDGGLAPLTTYSYRVLARNAGGASPYAEASATTTAAPPDASPVPRYTWSCTARKGRLCSFDGTSSTDDKGITSYAWTYGDGTSGSGATVTHRYGSTGTFQVSLTVSDGVNPSVRRTCAVGTGTTGTCVP
ncbi:MAG: S8 family serine peptidase [Gemmatimonadales bacterium]